MRRCRVMNLESMAYDECFQLQKRFVTEIQRGESDDTLLVVEHPHVITVGRNAGGGAVVADPALVAARGVRVAETDRGGERAEVPLSGVET